MKKADLVKGFVMKPIFEIMKKDYKIKSPTPSSLNVKDLGDDKYSIVYNGQQSYVDFSNTDLIKDLMVDIKKHHIYEALSI
jgi:hypothetical protein